MRSTVELVTPYTGSYPTNADRVLRHYRSACPDMDEELINDLIPEAMDMLEDYAGVIILPKTYREKFEGFPGYGGQSSLSAVYRAYDENEPYRLRLTHKPVVSISSIAYYDANGVSQAYTGFLHNKQTGDIEPAAYGIWPVCQFRMDSVEVLYVAGMGIIPPKVRTAVTALVLHWMDTPSAVTDKSLRTVPLGFVDIASLVGDGAYV